MKMIEVLALIVNIFAILILCYGFFNKFEIPKEKAIYGYILAGGFISYIIFISLCMCFEIINNNWWSLILSVGIISPFVIGKFVNFKTLKKYTIIQLLCFLFSFFVILFFTI